MDFEDWNGDYINMLLGFPDNAGMVNPDIFAMYARYLQKSPWKMLAMLIPICTFLPAFLQMT